MYQELWECNRTIIEMLKSRGYCNQHENEDQINHNQAVKTYSKFNETIKELCQSENEEDGSGSQYVLTQKVLDKLTYLRQHSFTGEWIYIFFVLDKIGVGLVTNYVENMTSSGVSRAMLISVPNENKTTLGDQSVLTPFAVKEIKKYKKSQGIIIEHFYFSDITINILNHKLQPKKINILTQEEKEKILEKLLSKDKEIAPLPRILPSDPTARFLGLQVGDMIKCICYSETTGECIRYRICWE